MVKSIATRYITKYGFDYVREWNFESWKSPDRWDFDGINMTADGFINYIESSYQGLLSASLSLANNKTTYKKRDLLSPNLRFGGPAGKCIPMTNDSLCGLVVDRLVKKLTESDGAERLNLFFSFEERGEKRVSEGLRSILDKETLVLSELSERLTGMTAEVEVMNSEADSEAGWSTPRSWQADAHYAALVARSMALHVEEYFLSRDTGNETGGSGPRFRFSSLNYENAYMSNFPHQFTQRTLLARFQVNNTFPPFVQFVKKPVFLVYGLMGLLGDQLLQHRMASANQTHVKIIATSAHDNQRNQKAYSFLVVNSLDQPVELTNGSIRVNVTLNFSLSDLNYEWRMSRYTVDNVRTNPYKVWKDQGSRPFFTHRLLSAMRVKSEPAMDISAEEVQIKVSADGFDHQTHLSFDLPQPAVTLILLCSKSDAGPDKVVHLRGVTVNEFEVLLLWSVSKSRCLKTYEVEFADTASVSRQFERVSSDVLLFASFNYLRKLSDVLHQWFISCGCHRKRDTGGMECDGRVPRAGSGHVRAQRPVFRCSLICAGNWQMNKKAKRGTSCHVSSAARRRHGRPAARLPLAPHVLLPVTRRAQCLPPDCVLTHCDPPYCLPDEQLFFRSSCRLSCAVRVS